MPVVPPPPACPMGRDPCPSGVTQIAQIAEANVGSDVAPGATRDTRKPDMSFTAFNTQIGAVIPRMDSQPLR